MGSRFPLKFFYDNHDNLRPLVREIGAPGSMPLDKGIILCFDTYKFGSLF